MGWASGFQSGVQLGKAALEAEKRRALEAVAKEQVQQQYTPEQGAEMERIAGLQTQNAAGEVVPQYQFTTTPGSTAYGLSQFNPETGGYEAIRQGGDSTPAYQVNPQTTFLGKSYDQPLSEDRVRGLRMRAMADAIAPYDPIEAQRLSANAAEQEHLAEMRPMQREKAGLELGAARRENVDAERMVKFDEWASANPELAGNFDEVAKKLREIGATTAQQFKVASNMTGIAESKFKANETEIKNKILGKSPDELLDMLKSDDKFEPGRHYVKRTDAKGKVITDAKGNFVVDMVDTQTGAVIQPNIFTGTNTQLGGFLSAAATSPAAVADYTMKYETHQAARDKDRAIANRYNTDAASSKKTFGQMQVGYEVGPDGQPKMVGLTPVRDTRTGALTMERTDLGTGGNFIPAEELSDVKLRPIAEDMVKNRAMQPTLKDGKRQPHTVESALAQLRQERLSRATSAKAGGQGGMSSAAAAIKAADAKAAPAAAAQPQRGIFTGARGETQLLQPLFDLNDYRRRMAADAAGLEDQYGP